MAWKVETTKNAYLNNIPASAWTRIYKKTYPTEAAAYAALQRHKRTENPNPGNSICSWTHNHRVAEC